MEGYSAVLKSYFRFTQQNGLADDLASFNKGTISKYMLFLNGKLKYTDHPTIAVKQKGVSINTLKVHARALKAFPSYLYRHGLFFRGFL